MRRGTELGGLASLARPPFSDFGLTRLPGVICGWMSDIYGGRRACVCATMMAILVPLLLLFAYVWARNTRRRLRVRAQYGGRRLSCPARKRPCRPLIWL